MFVVKLYQRMKAVVAAAGTLVSTVTVAAADQAITFEEAGLIVGAAFLVYKAVYKVRNAPAAATSETP